MKLNFVSLLLAMFIITYANPSFAKAYNAKFTLHSNPNSTYQLCENTIIILKSEIALRQNNISLFEQEKNKCSEDKNNFDIPNIIATTYKEIEYLDTVINYCKDIVNNKTKFSTDFSFLQQASKEEQAYKEVISFLKQVVKSTSLNQSKDLSSINKLVSKEKLDLDIDKFSLLQADIISQGYFMLNIGKVIKILNDNPKYKYINYKFK